MSMVVRDISYVTVSLLINHYMPVCSIVTVSLLMSDINKCIKRLSFKQTLDKTYPESVLSFTINIRGHI